jgi:hypothetical protein
MTTPASPAALSWSGSFLTRSSCACKSGRIDCGRETGRSFCPLQHMPEQEQQGSERLGLRGRGDRARDRQRGELGFHRGSRP